MRLFTIALASIASAFCAGTVLAASAGGSITGSVVDQTGKPIAGASVLYRSIQTMTKTAGGQRVLTGPMVGSGVKTSADGTFTVTGLPPAGYMLCAYGVKDNHLGSCEWGQGTTRSDIAAGQTAQLRFVVAEGTLLTFQVEDPKHQIIDLESLSMVNGRIPLSGGNFPVGVWAGAKYARAKLLSVNGAVRRYQLAIPKAATVRLHLDTSLRVADANGAALTIRQPSTAIAAGGQSEVVINLAIP